MPTDFFEDALQPRVLSVPFPPIGESFEGVGGSLVLGVCLPDRELGTKTVAAARSLGDDLRANS